MATKVTIGGSDDLFIGTDQILNFEILDTSDVPVDMTGWTVAFDVRTKDTSDTSLISKTASIVGVYNATRATNTQRARVTLTDDDLAADTVLVERTYRYTLKRTDAGSETVLVYGDFKPERVTLT